jgi:hypothetical protein
MKIHLYYAVLLCLFFTGCFMAPVSAVVAGNSTNGTPVYPANPVIPATHSTSPLAVLPETAGQMNLPVQAILLAAGVLIIIIAIAGLVWRYLHPKYVPPEERKRD